MPAERIYGSRKMLNGDVGSYSSNRIVVDKVNNRAMLEVNFAPATCPCIKEEF